MKKAVLTIFIIALLTGCSGDGDGSDADLDQQKIIAACDDLTAEFQSVLKQELMTALAEGGPENAIAVCNTKAPAIADSLSRRPGIDIRRVSLKMRNPDIEPDKFELLTLKTFAADSVNDPQQVLEKVLDSAGVRKYRYLKEIKTGELCLKCHGDPSGFSEALVSALDTYYPGDEAIGYQAGDSRGAFSIVITMPEAAAVLFPEGEESK